MRWKRSRFAHALGAVGAGAVAIFDQGGFESFRQVGEARHAIVDKIGVERLTVVVFERFAERIAQSLDRRAFVLASACPGLIARPTSATVTYFSSLIVAGFPVQRDGRTAHAGLPEQWKGLAQRAIRAHIAAADQFAAGHAEEFADNLGVAQ